MENKTPTLSVTARVVEFSIPPVSDGLVIGKESPIGFTAVSRALQLLVANQFHTIAIEDDDVISHVIIRRNLLRRVPEDRLIAFIRERIRPLMVPDEILHLSLTVEVKVEDGEL